MGTNLDARFDEWNKWLDVIDSEITTLAGNRHIFWEIQDIVKNNLRIQKPSAFYEFLADAYAASAVIGVRKQIKVDKGSISLARLLTDICEAPSVLSRDRFLALYEGHRHMLGIANFEFDKYAGPGKEHVNGDVINSDLERLKQVAKNCEKYADRRIAHFDKRDMKELPTFKDLNMCIDALEELLERYLLLFRATTRPSIVPVIQYDWKAIFRESWLR